MKITFIKKAIIILTGVVFSSCGSMLYTTLDVLRPAKVTFPAEVKKILVVNNTVQQPADFGHKTQLMRENIKNNTVKTDSLAIFCLASLAEEIRNREFFLSVELLEKSINPSTDFFYVKELKQDTVTALCKRYNADAILSLNRIKVSDKITEYYIEEERKYVADLDANYESQWSIHLPGENKYTAATFRDTVFWESESYQRKKVLDGLPKRTDALIDGSLYVGQNTVKKLIPNWEKVDRYFFQTSNKYMTRAMDSVYVKNWKSAIENWERVISKSYSNNLKAKASNNIAIAYEIMGDIDNAIIKSSESLVYFEKSISTDYDSYMLVKDYADQLKQRKKEIGLVKKQLGE